MKNILALIALITIFSCKEEPKDYATLSGKITNPKEDILTVIKGRNFEKKIVLNEDGSFSDTLKVEEGTHYFKHGDEYGQIFLKNNNTTRFTLDAENFDETLSFEGDDASKSNFFTANALNIEKHLSNEGLFDAAEEEFNTTMDNLRKSYGHLKADFSDLDSTFFKQQDQELEKMIKSYSSYFQSKLAIRKEFPAGTPSPTFESYENYSGGNTSLSDLKGKYVYVDVWATWCGPCKVEIPHLKELEKEYHDKNIAFVSISVDNGRGYKAETEEEAFNLSKDGWKKMIAEKEMGGIQLFSDKAWESDFVQGYKITGIPRFILIDPDGNIVSADAPRPSSPAIKELFNSLNI